MPKPKPVHASVSRAARDSQANALPREEAEWLKFDVIILGDVSPATLTAVHTRSLKKFVSDRGGTLIVIAGRQFMPHAYADNPLAQMLPVFFEPGKVPQLAPGERAFRIALTPEAIDNVIMRLSIDPDENLSLWKQLPSVYWRHPTVKAKEGAAVLAYALTPSSAKTIESLTDHQRRAFERQRPLIAYQNVAMGKVIFLGFDRTWRLRYRTGDTHHHKFWGQILRWATADKLPGGTNLVKLGTDRPQYPAGSEINVRAKIVEPDYTPVISKEVAVNVTCAGQRVLRKKLKYVSGSPGIYTGELGKLPSGAYRVELDAPAAADVLAAEDVEKVVSVFSVDPAAPIEQAELSGDRGLAGRLAQITGGVVADPHSADRVISVLPPGRLVNHQRRQFVIWNCWPLLVMIIAVATTEWLLRKKVGLA